MFSTLHLFKTHPFFRLLVAYIAGIIVAYYLKISQLALLTVSFVVLLLLISFSFSPPSVRFKFRYQFGSLLLFAVCCAGAFSVQQHSVVNDINQLGNFETAPAIVVQLNEDLIAKQNWFKAEAKLIAIQKEKLQRTRGKIIIYFSRKEFKENSFRQGDVLAVGSKLQRIKNSGNPGAFDYAAFCARQNILHQTYVTGSQVKFIRNNASKFDLFFGSIRKFVLNALEANIRDRNALGIAEALLIGYKTDLDKDLIQAYSNTGVIHIIAISGLHLALIYGLLLKTVNLLPYFRSKKSKYIIVLICLWVFSILTGSSPSVLRAAVMFSFIIGGELVNKPPKPLNTLAVSAFCLLLYDPMFLWDAGFQLSYAAVASIMIFYQPLYNLFCTKNKLLDAFWKLNAVTISAQILTLPFVIYHFKQFPNLFLFTNMVAVPLSGIILYAELLLIAFSPFSAVASLVGKITSLMIILLNDFISYMNNFRYAVTDQINWNILHAMLALTAIAFIASAFLQEQKKHLFIGLSVLFVLSASISFNSIISLQNPTLVVYNINKKSAVEILTKKANYFFGDKSVLETASLFNFHIKPTHTAYNTSNTFNIIYPKHFEVNGWRLSKGNTTSGTDISIISGNPSIGAVEMRPQVIYIADNTNAAWKINRWKKQADSLHLRFHSIPDDGAFVMELKRKPAK